ncbi:MAG: purine-nucleoside phosphorylase [Solirubrobacterales bacterium]|nr:purine-nucleoside phosphorylase [Solirubrobacterales bacterium]
MIAPDAAAAVAAVRARTDLVPRVGIVLGSGLGAVADAVEDAVDIPYSELPGFPVGAVVGHARTLHLGTLAGVPVAVLQGRAHLYEGVDPAALRVPVRTLYGLGAELLLLTNAAGSLVPEVGPGRLMALTDHINLMGANPLTGPNEDAVGPRFVPLGAVYDADLRERLHAAAQAEAITLADGVYLAVSGPSFETPAEIRAFRTLGADAVGMSTVPEAIVAAHCGLRVAAVSCITNLAEGLGDELLSHENTLAAAALGAADLTRLVPRFLEEL